MTDARKVWMPDTFFRNEKEGRFHNILVPNVYIRIFPTGYVLYSIRWENKSFGNIPKDCIHLKRSLCGNFSFEIHYISEFLWLLPARWISNFILLIVRNALSAWQAVSTYFKYFHHVGVAPAPAPEQWFLFLRLSPAPAISTQHIKTTLRHSYSQRD